ncbi:MAG: hypothetical protein ABJG47_08165 [Ekhidna sp.]
MEKSYLRDMKGLCVLFFLSTLFVSCSEEEKRYPFEQSPYAEFDDLEFHDSSSLDTLLLTFTIWDIEGDIGSDLNEVNEFELILDELGRPVTISGDQQPSCYLPITSRKLQDIDVNYEADGCRVDFTIPERPPFSCDEYQIIKDDTLFIRRIKGYYDLLIDFKNVNNENYNFQEIFNSSDCNLGNFNARLIDFANVDVFRPIEVNPYKIKKLSKFSYQVSYMMLSSGWKPAIGQNQFELEFQVIDQTLNESNVATSGLVTLEKITQK